MNQPDPTTFSATAAERRERAGGDLPLPTYMPMLETFVLRSPGGVDWPDMLRRAVLLTVAFAVFAVGASLLFVAMVMAMALVPAALLGFLGALFVGGAVVVMDRVKTLHQEARKESELSRAEQP